MCGIAKSLKSVVFRCNIATITLRWLNITRTTTCLNEVLVLEVLLPNTRQHFVIPVCFRLENFYRETAWFFFIGELALF